MKKLIKSISVMTAAVLAGLTLASCGAPADNPASDSNAAKTDKLKVGVIQMIDNGAFSDMREGFIQELRDKGYTEDKCEIVYKNAQGDATNLNTIVQDVINSKVDLIATIATPATQAVVGAGTDIPTVFVAVSNPTGAGVITDMSKPDKNATGTSNAIPVDTIFGLAEKVTPNVKTYGILYNTSEINSVSTADSAKKYLDSKGLKYVEATVTNSSEIQQAAQSFVGKVDAIFVPNDAMIQSGMPLVAEVAKNAKIPVYGSSAVMVNSGAFATIAVSDKEIGAISADKAIKYFEGAKIEEIPAEVVPANDVVINKKTAEAIGVTIPSDVNARLIDGE